MPRKSKYEIVEGSVFNKLTAIKATKKINYRRYWLFVCECTNEVEIEIYNVLRGSTKSCGCLKKDWNIKNKTTHGCGGVNRSPEYVSWSHMKYRCDNSNCPDYDNYGGRGISITKKWYDFTNFYADMGKRPSFKHTLERIDVNGNYNKNNCRWADPVEQANNRRNTLMVFYEDRWQSVTDISNATGLSPKTIKYRNRHSICSYGKLRERGII